ncbi:hypothetical protein GTR04_1663 [Trichophyton interdigitale]|uniref:Uncharacterized protein n=1 Tax=Trichophyton interdigitale TaxID=101480 RepID=A0A9P4YJ49_9EURO|nr:hypothetical protein GY631_1469 [Trichophyton interdigitale]KAF3899559.1 hypothetical protein GY632_1259 [Trichophyton interdigitale]KAG8210953.1 hypothetical protein GTR04_1663 [Trichophyton interdigitale]
MQRTGLSDFSTPTPTGALVLQVAIEPFSSSAQKQAQSRRSVCVGEDKEEEEGREEEEEEEEGSHDAGDGRQPQKETTVGDSTASQLLTGTGLCARTRARGWSSGRPARFSKRLSQKLSQWLLR